MFYDREGELEALWEEHESDGFSLTIIYGRRRVGKTELIKKFCEGKDHLYHLASQEAAKVQRERFIEELASYEGDRVPHTENWLDAADYLGEVLSRGKQVVALDEFPYLVESDETVLSAFQALVDSVSKESSSTLILCGSSIGVMESEVMGHESPLYGRRTSQIDLQPFSFSTSLRIIDYPFEESVRAFSATGGMPMYLTLMDYEEDLRDNILENHLSKSSLLYSEPEFILRTELRNPSRYMSILEAIATGHATPNEISGATGVEPGPLSNYLNRLRRLRLVEREVPVTANRKKSKRSTYQVKDEFFRFWFRFVEPNRSGIEEAPEMVLDNNIMPDLDLHVSSTFEEVCREAVWTLSRSDRFNGSYGSVGRWWYGEHEVDVAALDHRTPSLLLGECKWTKEPVGFDLAKKLEEKSGHVRWNKGTRREEFVLFSRSGFVEGLQEELDDRWSLYGPDDLEHLLR